MAKDKQEEDRPKFNIGDQVSFKLEKQNFTGNVEKAYTNSYLVSFKSDDTSIVDKYHNRTVVNYKDLKLIKAVSKKDKK